MTRQTLTVLWGEAPAKVNLALAVTGRREDGYHTLGSVFLRLALHDHLEVRAAADPGAMDELTIDGEPGLPLHDNLVLRAAARLRHLTGQPLPALRFRLDKHIPAAAGLAGGSSDAATALQLAAQAWALPDDGALRLAAARRLGADVPFFVAGHAAARVSGIGEFIEPLPGPTSAAGLLLVTSATRLSTAAVFAEHDRAPAPGAARQAAMTEAQVEHLATALRSGLDGAALAGLAARLRDANDLWPAATRLAPSLAPAREALEATLGRAFLLTGSGPTLFAVYPSQEAAATAAAELEEARPALLHGATITATQSSPTGGPS
jgi:4-diphosphocytidyl-2-C-methyl-D-erythritol kinase